MNDEFSKYYELLGVSPGASTQELKTAHRDLAKVWHPDRFAHDPRLQQKAQEKLKEINEAYDQLTSGKARRRTETPSTTDRAYTQPPPTLPKRYRWQLFLLAMLVFCVAFYAASSALLSPDKQRSQSAATQSSTIEQEERSESSSNLPVGGSTRGKRADQQSTKGAEAATPLSEQDTGQIRPLPTVTVTIDPTTGLIAKSDCPIKSRMTYPAGAEPHQYCNASHQAAEPAQPKEARPKESRLKSLAKRLAAPARWIGSRGESNKEIKSAEKIP